jgi:hypothetical protein
VREQVIAGWGELQKVSFIILTIHQILFRVIKLIKLVGHVARMGKKKMFAEF